MFDVIGFIVILLSRCCLPNDQGPGPPNRTASAFYTSLHYRITSTCKTPLEDECRWWWGFPCIRTWRRVAKQSRRTWEWPAKSRQSALVKSYKLSASMLPNPFCMHTRTQSFT